MDREHVTELRRRLAPFTQAMNRSGSTLDEMAIGFSRALQPDLDGLDALTDLDELAADCPTPTRDGVIQHLFGSGLLRGDRDDYHRWQNSCIDRVIAEGRGMPISLSVIAIEVARRLGVRLVGIGLPGHFVVGDADDPGWYADPYRGLSGLTPVDLRTMLARMGGPTWSSRFVEPVPDRLIVARMLNNLKLTCEHRRDRVRLAIVMEARQVMPEFAGERPAARAAMAVFN
jgi:regulator of sirC expression with transglutaminase-like and TPR domain